MHHLFGDSHIHWINNTNITKHLFSAGSAMGLNNPNSVSGYQNKFLEIYKNIPESEKIILKFGQVDTEFVYYIKLASNNNLSFVDFANDSITKYFNLLKSRNKLREQDIIWAKICKDMGWKFYSSEKN